jgi:hypothetical protein
MAVYYAYGLQTHCGIDWAFFDGRLWVADPPLDDGSGNPPDGWDNPRQVGFMGLRSHREAEFRAGDRRAHFRPAPPGFEPPGCA